MNRRSSSIQPALALVATVILVYLLHVTINFAGLLVCVGLFFTLPLTSLLLAVTYLALSDGSPGFVEAEPGTWEVDETG